MATIEQMRVIPVIDVMKGQVVRAVAGRRSEYRPIDSPLAADARPATIARALVERFDPDLVYVADLDAIQLREPNVDAWQAINAAGANLWLDAGAGDPQRCDELGQTLREKSIDARIVVALECLVDLHQERWTAQLTSAFRPPIFSLDLKDGVPLRRKNVWPQQTPIEIAHAAYRLGFRDMIVLDLADVGIGRGTTTLPLCKQLKRDLSDVRLIAGGGVRGIDDLRALFDAGCDAAMVASALHDGRLTPQDVREVESWQR